MSSHACQKSTIDKLIDQKDAAIQDGRVDDVYAISQNVISLLIKNRDWGSLDAEILAMTTLRSIRIGELQLTVQKILNALAEIDLDKENSSTDLCATLEILECVISKYVFLRIMEMLSTGTVSR
jgi:hypothetical protein